MEATELNQQVLPVAEEPGTSVIEEFVSKVSRVQASIKNLVKAVSGSMVVSKKYAHEDVFMIFFNNRWTWDCKLAFVALLNLMGIDKTYRYKSRNLTFRKDSHGKPYIIVSYSIRAIGNVLEPEREVEMDIEHSVISDLMRKTEGFSGVSEEAEEYYDPAFDAGEHEESFDGPF